MIFDRNPATGRADAARRGWIGERAAVRAARGRALGNPNGIVISPDGAKVYVSSGAHDHGRSTATRRPAI